VSRNFLVIEKGFRIFKENSDTVFIDFIFDSGTPGGDAGEQDAAPIGSMFYQQNGTGSKQFQKIRNVGAASDWRDVGSTVQIGTFRPEKVRAVTGENVGNGVRNLTVSPFTDDETPFLVATDFAVGEFLIDNSGVTPVLREVTDVSSPNITLSTPDPNLNPVLAENDTFIVPNFLPDTPGNQEGQAVVQFNGTVMAKIGDVNWAFADGINLLGSITDRNGPVAGNDTLQVSTEKLEGDAKDTSTTLGLARGAVDFGAFTTPASLLLAAAQTAKALFQRLGVLLAQLRGVEVTGVSAITTIDSVPVASVQAAKWLIEAFDEAATTKRKAQVVYALNDGATVSDDTIFAKLQVGTPPLNLIVTVDVVGGDMRLRVSSSATVTVRARRIEVVKSVL